MLASVTTLSSMHSDSLPIICLWSTWRTLSNIVFEGLCWEESSTELCRREGIAQSLYCSRAKEFLEAGKKRLAGNSAREASSGETRALRREVRDLKEIVAEQVLEIGR